MFSNFSSSSPSLSPLLLLLLVLLSLLSSFLRADCTRFFPRIPQRHDNGAYSHLCALRWFFPLSSHIVISKLLQCPAPATWTSPWNGNCHYNTQPVQMYVHKHVNSQANARNNPCVGTHVNTSANVCAKNFIPIQVEQRVSRYLPSNSTCQWICMVFAAKL